MKVNREIVTTAALALLNRVGLEGLTLRLLADELDVKAATLYWHFKSKQELIDEVATAVLAKGAPQLLPARESADWTGWATAFGAGLRQVLLAYRDGARTIAGTRLNGIDYMKIVERIAGRLVEAGFTVREATVLLSTIYNYTVSFTMEEQAVFPRPGERSAQYDLAQRKARLADAGLPLLRQAGEILFDKFDRRYKEGLMLIVRGAGLQVAGHDAPA
ncbi:TetR/AcrR family transcriptional regulator C-terminal domain-containing protein [Variovorax sp. dw_308]|uniref:TetR/AcrR family transcriptional regulator C-terminal domain-containing protein n=1 Tax=Variovorax sp. dw_308 TaxID=2721546 RepID=UPI001C47486A|nr:TetR/AcrR family transcriptional regulator C-terminal domain-containing protein [Variovorax sp. dw_308]